MELPIKYAQLIVIVQPVQWNLAPECIYCWS